MAFKSETASTKDIEELLDAVDTTLDRLKTLYEQYFLGIQKQAPGFIHNDVERKLRDLTQMNIRNTGLRYRLATLQQKFGSYNSYWRRTVRQIENGTYARNLAKIGREAARNGTEIPDEILAAMPKRMREQVLRDRDQALAIAKRRKQVEDSGLDGATADVGQVAEALAAPRIAEPSTPHRDIKTRSGALVLDDDEDLDFDKLFAAFQDDRPDATSTQAITRPVPRIAPERPTAPVPPPQAAPPAAAAIPPRIPSSPTTQPTMALPRVPAAPPPLRQQTGPVPIVTPPTATSAIPRVGESGAIPRVPMPPSQSGATRAPGVGDGSGPTPRPQTGAVSRVPPVPPPHQTQPIPRVPQAPPARPPARPAAPLKPPPGMTEADVNALHAKYVQAKQMVGEKVDASSREKLLKTIHQTAPKIMQQYKASGVDFSVVVKDNQVVIKAKPKT